MPNPWRIPSHDIMRAAQETFCEQHGFHAYRSLVGHDWLHAVLGAGPDGEGIVFAAEHFMLGSALPPFQWFRATAFALALDTDAVTDEPVRRAYRKLVNLHR